MSVVDPATGADAPRTRAIASVREFALFLEQQVGSRAASEDILRDAFVRNRRDLLQASEQICSWFYRSLRDAVLDQPRYTTTSEGKLAAFRSELAQKIEPNPAMRDAIIRHVEALTMTLAAEKAELLRSVDFGGEELAEHARRSGMSTGSVAQLFGLARAELCLQVVRSFAACNTHGLHNCTCGASLGGYGRQRGSSR
jgi:DNA-directed RNA polymerase specialized sigma24 family protein